MLFNRYEKHPASYRNTKLLKTLATISLVSLYIFLFSMIIKIGLWATKFELIFWNDLVNVFLVVSSMMAIVFSTAILIEYVKIKHGVVVISIAITIILIIIVAIGTIYFMIANPLKWEDYNPDIGGLIGGFLSSIAAMLVIMFSLSTEERRNHKLAQTSARFLASILNDLDTQIRRLENGWHEPIIYPENWMQYYFSVYEIAKYDYLELLNKEFDYVRLINSSLNNKNYNSTKSLLVGRRDYNLYSFSCTFSYLEVQENLSRIGQGNEEKKSWVDSNDYIKLADFLIDQYYSVIENYVYGILLSNSSSDTNEIEISVRNWLLKNPTFQELQEKRLISYVIFRVFCAFSQKSERVSYVWGELSLK